MTLLTYINLLRRIHPEMKHMLIKRLFFFLTALPLLVACDKPDNEPRLSILYGLEALPEPLSKYDLLVFQPYNYKSLEHLTPKQQALIYVNLGKSYPSILSTEAPPHLTADFNGIWRNYIVGTPNTSIDLTHSIQTPNPELKILLNRGFDTWPEIGSGGQVTFLENIFTHHHFANQRPRLQASDITKQHIARIRPLKDTTHHLQFFCIEYWDINDKRGLAKRHKIQRKHDLMADISTSPLDRLYAGPGANELMTTNGATNA
jgi:hypothetical protein